MFICKIYNSESQLVCEFTTDEEKMGKSISVGRSPQCLISLPDCHSIEDMHFAIVKKNNAWRLENPGNDVAFSNGKKIEDIELVDLMKILFGACMMRIEKKKNLSRFDLAWETSENKSIQRAHLYEGENLAGSAAYCDIVITSHDCAPEHLKIIADNSSFVLQNINSGYTTTISGRELTEKTAVSLGQIFYFGAVPLIIIPQTTQNSEVSFISDKINWQLLNIILIFITLALIILIAWNHLTSNDDLLSHTSLNNLNNETEQILLTRIKTDIEKGMPSNGIDEIGELLRRTPNNAEYKQLETALGIELNAVENMRLYVFKAQETEKHNATISYIEFLFSSKDTDKQLKLDIEYWQNVQSTLASFKQKITNNATIPFKRIQAQSYFLNHYRTTEKITGKIANKCNVYLKLNDAWNKENWNTVIKIINDLKASNESSQYKDLNTYLTHSLKTAKFAENFKNLTDDFSNSNFETYDLDQFKNHLKVNSQEYSKLVNTFPSANLKNNLERLKLSANLLTELKKRLAVWNANPNDLNDFSALSEFINNKQLYDSPYKIMSKAYAFINTKMYQFVSSSIDEIKIQPDKNFLQKCYKLENFMVTMGTFGSDAAFQKLQDKTEKIKLAIRIKCDTIYTQYQSDKQTGNLNNLKKCVIQIFKTAPDNSTYHLWAEKELKNFD